MMEFTRLSSKLSSRLVALRVFYDLDPSRLNRQPVLLTVCGSGENDYNNELCTNRDADLCAEKIALNSCPSGIAIKIQAFSGPPALGTIYIDNCRYDLYADYICQNTGDK